MRILHVITGLNAGGAEHQLRLLLRELDAATPAATSGRRFECEVVTLTNPGAVADAIRADGTPVHDLRMRGNRDLGALPRLVRLIRAGRFDVVHTHLYRACVYGRIAARLAGVRQVVATEHSLGPTVIEGRPITRGVRLLYRATERLGQHTVAVSGAVEGYLRDWGVPGARITVIPNGVDAAELAFDPARRAAVRADLGIAADAVVVGGLGRLEPTKRFDRLIRAVAAIPGVSLLLVGTGSAHRDLVDLAAELGVSDRTVFAGASAHARDMLCAMDVFVSPSDAETFGLAVLEALAAGLPVLYASCPPLAELDPSHGLAPQAQQVASDPSALPAALREQLAGLADPGRPARLPVPPAVSHYSADRMATAVGRLYERATAVTTRRGIRSEPLIRSETS
jgi:glycosyltransferase involved in cell wall biosynthesis